jgi:aspartate racemase
MSKIVGILGGMGPMATADLFTKIVHATPASVDQEHLRIIIDNHPQIPSRVDFINGVGVNPLPQMVESARLLEKAGVDFIVIPCNTAHYWYDDIQAAVGVPMFNIITCAAEYVAAQSAGQPERILLLARKATLRTGLFQASFKVMGLELIVPKPDEQDLIELTVEAVKAGAIAQNPYLEGFNQMLEGYRQAGTTAVLAGCTEIPLLFAYLKDGLKKFDTTQILADKVVREAMKF